MAKSYYKQSERPVVEGVNWGQISSDLGAKLQAESKRREDLKTQLDTESRDYMREFNDTPQGQHDGANERMSRFADDASMYMLDLDKKLKAGQLPLRDYNAMRANLQQGTTDMFDVSKKFNADYGASLERAGSGNASAEEVYQNQQIQAFGDPANSGVYIDPVSGQMSVAKMIDDGDGNMVMSSNPSDRKSIFSLKNTVERKIDNFNVNEFSEGIKGAYDVKFQKILNDPNTSEGTKTTMLQSEDFQKATNDLISRELVNTHNAASILTNRAGKEYKFVTLANDKLPEVQEEGVIYLVPDPTNPNSGASQPLLTEKQTDEATEILRTAINSKIGVTETSSLEVDRDIKALNKDLTQFEKEYKEATAEQRVKIENLRIDKFESDLTAAKTIEEKRQIELKYFEEEKILGITKKEADITAATSAEEVRQIELKYLEDEKILGITKKESDITAATSIEEKRQIELKHLDENLELDNDILKKKLEAASKEESTMLKDYSSYVQNQYTLTEADIANETDAVENLTMAYGDLQFEFAESTPLKDAIEITSPDGETTTTIMLDSPNAAQAIQNFINLNTPLLTIGRLDKSGSLQKSTTEEGSNETSIDTSSY